MDGLWLALVGGGFTVLGVTATALFSYLMQRQTQNNERLRWEIDSADRELQRMHDAAVSRQARFHDERIVTYVEFVTATWNATGYLTSSAIERHGDLPDGTGPGPRFRYLRQLAGSDADESAPRRMMLLRAKVAMLGEPPVGQAAEAVNQAVMQLMFVPHDHPEWNATLAEANERIGRAVQDFEIAARAELIAEPGGDDLDAASATSANPDGVDGR